MKKLNEIADAILKYRRMKAQLKEHNLIIRDMAFDAGMPQELLNKVSILDFLDGYLVGHGITKTLESYGHD